MKGWEESPSHGELQATIGSYQGMYQDDSCIVLDGIDDSACDDPSTSTKRRGRLLWAPELCEDAPPVIQTGT
jgi:hypothetical protein